MPAVIVYIKIFDLPSYFSSALVFAILKSEIVIISTKASSCFPAEST